MRHYVLTRCAYAPSYPLADNRRRLEIMKATVVPSLRSQTTRDLTWLVLVDPEDPLLEERREVIASAGLPAIVEPAGQLVREGIHDKPFAPWARYIDFSSQTLTTRLDDDDGLATYALERVQEAAHGCRESVVWTLPVGYRVVGYRAFRIEWPLAQFGTLAVPPRVKRTVFDASHQQVGHLGPLVPATTDPAWLWIRHRLTRSRVQVGRQTMLNGRTEGRGLRITPAVSDPFAIDWQMVVRLLR